MILEFFSHLTEQHVAFNFFLFAHTLKQPHKCHYKLENTPSFLYTSVQATYS